MVPVALRSISQFAQPEENRIRIDKHFVPLHFERVRGVLADDGIRRLSLCWRFGGSPGWQQFQPTLLATLLFSFISHLLGTPAFLVQLVCQLWRHV